MYVCVCVRARTYIKIEKVVKIVYKVCYNEKKIGKNIGKNEKKRASEMSVWP